LSSWEEWFRRMRERMFMPFSEIDKMFMEMEREMEKMMKELERGIPRSLIREKVTPDGARVREYGPFIWGYTMTIGPDGKPVIREFGNIRPELMGAPPRPSLNVQEYREPLVDVVETDDEIKVVAELPGVEKDQIQLYATERGLTISVDTPERKYYKELELPAEVDPSTAKSKYRNGILEVVLKKAPKKPKGVRLKVE